MSDQLTAPLPAWPRVRPPHVVLAGEDDAGEHTPDVLVVAVRPSGAGPTEDEDVADATGDRGSAMRWWQAVRPAVCAVALARYGLAEAARDDEAEQTWSPAWRDRVATTGTPSGRDGDTTTLPVPPAAGLPFSRLVLVGVDAASGPVRLRRTAGVLARQLRGKALTVVLPALEPEGVRAFVEGLLLGGYQPGGLHAGDTDRVDDGAADPADDDGAPAPATIVLDVDGARQDDVVLGRLHALATIGARDLAVTPSNLKSPEWLAAQAQELAGDRLTVRVRHQPELIEAGFGGIVTVGAGSMTPPVLIELDYVPEGGDPDQPPLVLVGKGITYDTGGLSIKPRESMVPMKTDMAGAAAVLEALRACPELGVRRRVVGLLPCAENAVGAASYRPSDVVTHYGGTTVEVANTDAEGRMVLADALAYAVADLGPAAIVDLATLTGAATLGLGKRHAALYSDDDELARALEAAGAASGEQVWRMPLVADYLPALESDVADLRHVPAKAVWGGGSITAALFLREFTGGLPWAHLDIAGTGRADKDEYEVSRGATGFGARLLLRWLEAHSADTRPGSAAVDVEE